MYNKVSTGMNFVEREKEVEKFWKDKDIFRKSIKLREGAPTYMFYDGPPTANGKPHIGHVLTRVIKDMIPRYRTMKGYRVPRKAGWDTHGLPVELEVEKLLGLDGKEQIEEYGMEPFINQCKESVWKYKGMWEDFSDTVGFWADMDDPYVTYDDNYIESEWWALKEIWNKDLLYKGFKIVPYCPRCGTPLSAQEVAQGYKTVKERSAIVRFKVTGEDAYFLAWTTTPWTLPSNVDRRTGCPSRFPHTPAPRPASRRWRGRLPRRSPPGCRSRRGSSRAAMHLPVPPLACRWSEWRPAGRQRRWKQPKKPHRKRQRCCRNWKSSLPGSAHRRQPSHSSEK